MNSKVLKFVDKIERVVIITLLFSLLIVVVYTAVVFLFMLFNGIITSIESSFSDNNILVHLHKVFGGFLSVLIGIELLHTIKMYLKEDVVHVEIVLLVALIGISRHIIDLDIIHIKPITIFGISSLVLALSIGYYLIKKGMRIKKK